MDTDNVKKQIEVVINGKVYRLSTTDNEDYIKSVAEYVNRKYTEIARETSSVTRLSEHFPVLLALNIADDLFKQSAESGENLKEKSDLENRIFKLENEFKAAEASIGEKEKALEAAKLEGEKLKDDLKAKEEAEAALKAGLEEAEKAAEALKEENKRLSLIITDAGLIPPTPDKNGRIKDKDKDRETLLKELNDIKSENGRTKKENRSLSERLKAVEEELALFKTAPTGASEAASEPKTPVKAQKTVKK
ncbi:MAG: cell division protein ZapA [Clostridiales bacterium]|nr:cell division protein ZapA [Clostridiales bacterium]